MLTLRRFSSASSLLLSSSLIIAAGCRVVETGTVLTHMDGSTSAVVVLGKSDSTLTCRRSDGTIQTIDRRDIQTVTVSTHHGDRSAAGSLLGIAAGLALGVLITPSPRDAATWDEMGNYMAIRIMVMGMGAICGGIFGTRYGESIATTKAVYHMPEDWWLYRLSVGHPLQEDSAVALPTRHQRP